MKKEHFKDEIIGLAFEMTEKLQAQYVWHIVTFVFFQGRPLILEISYGFAQEGYDALLVTRIAEVNWHPGVFNPYGWMVEGSSRSGSKSINLRNILIEAKISDQING